MVYKVKLIDFQWLIMLSTHNHLKNVEASLKRIESKKMLINLRRWLKNNYFKCFRTLNYFALRRILFLLSIIERWWKTEKKIGLRKIWRRKFTPDQEAIEIIENWLWHFSFVQCQWSKRHIPWRTLHTLDGYFQKNSYGDFRIFTIFCITQMHYFDIGNLYDKLFEYFFNSFSTSKTARTPI